ncbi:HAD family hydrolase, partial [bacterium]|nr:HAD family hydrolase [bacterium]
MLKAVFFDMGGTIDFYRQTREFRQSQAYLIRDCLKRGGIGLPWSDEQLVDALGSGIACYYEWNSDSNIELSPAEVWSRFILNGLNITPEALAPIAEELALINETRMYMREMRPEMPQVLEQIKELGLKIGIISNTQSQYQVPTNLKEYGIFDYFDPIVLSSEYGRRKPDPAIFYTAARLANVPTGACVFVGDVISKDVLGANRAGFRLAIQIINPYA